MRRLRHHLPSAVVARMQRQHGLVTRPQLVEDEGLPARRVDWWLESRVLEAVHAAIYRRSAGYVPPSQPLLAAVWSCGEGAVAGARPSLRLQGATRLPSRGVEVAIPAPRHLRPKAFPVVVTRLTPADRSSVGGIPVMCCERAVIAIAPYLSEPELRGLIDDLRRDGRLSLDALRRRAEGMRSLHGARLVLAVLVRGDFEKETEGERHLERLLVRFHPQPLWQIDDLVPGRRFDAGWLEALYVLEFDGRDHHVLPTDRDRDGLRDMETTDGHLLVHRITGGMIREQGDRVLGHIRTTYERRLIEVVALTEAGLLPAGLVDRMTRAA